MSDIFNEVDDALRREKAAKFWKSWGPTLILAAIIMVVATGATSAYRAWEAAQNRAETSKLVAATDEKDIGAAMEKAGNNSSDNHKGVAMMNAASKYADKKDFAKAAELYDGVAKDSGAPADLRDLSNILYTRAAILAAGDKAADYKAMIARLEPVAKNEKSAFRSQAQLEAALLYGNGLKDYTRALELLKDFDAGTGNNSLQEKATALTHVYEYEAANAAKAD